MFQVRRVLVAGMATLLLAGACASVSPGPTIPAINIPSIPPLNFSIPPIAIPSGGFNFSIPPLNLPSGFDIPIPSGSTACALVTGAEVSQVMGGAFTDMSDDPKNCTFISSQLSSISVQQTDDTDFTGIRILKGNTAQDINVGGFPGVAGTAIGVPAVYVQKSSGQIQILGFAGGNGADTLTKLQQIAAVGLT